MRPIRHQASARNRKKALHHAKCLHEELEYIHTRLRRMVDENMRYALGRIERLVNRLEAEQSES